MKSLMTVEEASQLIRKGQRMFISGEESLLSRLPKGEWAGGTIPYFMTEDGGMCAQDKVQVAVLPDFVTGTTVQLYGAAELGRIPVDYTRNGFSYIVIPGMTEAHQTFAKDCSTWHGVFNRPLVGWVAGSHLDNLGKTQAKVVNGQTGEVSGSKAVVMHVDLPAGKYAQVNIINLFQQGSGDVITFPTVGFEARECFVNGRPQNLAHYLKSANVNTQLPMVADYRGVMVNVAFQSADAENGKVAFVAPVFPGMEYKIAKPIGNYEVEFSYQLSRHNVRPVFTCNCILNYLYAKLEGKKTGGIVGPMTFGEIAYMLLNQTLVYLTFGET